MVRFVRVCVCVLLCVWPVASFMPIENTKRKFNGLEHRRHPNWKKHLWFNALTNIDSYVRLYACNDPPNALRLSAAAATSLPSSMSESIAYMSYFLRIMSLMMHTKTKMKALIVFRFHCLWFMKCNDQTMVWFPMLVKRVYSPRWNIFATEGTNE